MTPSLGIPHPPDPLSERRGGDSFSRLGLTPSPLTPFPKQGRGRKVLPVGVDPIPPDPLPQTGKGEKGSPGWGKAKLVPPCLGRDLGWGKTKPGFRVG
jgi:hypothetical protein